MLSVNQISKSYNLDLVLSQVSFTLNRGERMGLVGPNGCGKTTLLRIITRELSPDSGVVRFNPSDLRLGYLPQGLSFSDVQTLGEFLGLDDTGAPLLVQELERLAGELAHAPDQPGIHRAYDRALADLLIASQAASRIPEILFGLGLGSYSFSTPLRHFSGGQKTRLALARVLASDPQLLLLDEPTNHLDLEMLDWLESWLVNFPGAVLAVSHDRAFLDAMTTTILEIDLQTHAARQYPGNYSAYLEQKLAERERQWQEYKDQQDEIARLRAAAAAVEEKARFKKGGKGDSGDKFARGFFANRTKETIRRARQLEARIDRLLGDDRIDKPRQSWQMKLEFGQIPSSGQDVLVMDRLSVGYGDLCLLEEINLVLRYGARVALTGSNGSGKTTLLRTVMGQIPALGGSLRLGSNVKVGYMTQEQEDLDPRLSAFEILLKYAPVSETEARTFLHKFLFTGDDVFTPSGLLSYGERARLSLACLAAQGCNFLILDEPINHLDIPSRARFEQALTAFDGTVLAVVHDRYFITGFASEIWNVEGRRLVRHWLEAPES